MTLPAERTRAVIMTGEFLHHLATANHIKRIPKPVRQIARALRRHYPFWFELGKEEYWDEDVARSLIQEVLARSDPAWPD